MATVLEEFLVSVRYAKDAASEQSLLESLKKICTTTTIVASSIIGLGVAVFKLTDHFAKLGDEAYHTSQRLGSTIADIDATAYAMTAFGVSTEEAKGAMEGLGSFTRNFGPAATGFMSALGISATDTEGRLRQLGDFLRQGGMRPGMEGTMQYAMMLRWGRLMAPGASEQSLRAVADPRFGQTLDEAHDIQRHVFGIHGEGREAEEERSRALQKMGEQAHRISILLDDFGFMFSAISKVFSSKLFAEVEPQFRTLFKTLESYIPTINKLFAGLAVVIGILMTGLNDILWGFDLVAKGINWVAQAADLGTPAIDGLAVAVGALSLALMRNPIVLMGAALLGLILILDDLRAYFQGGKHVFNWEGLFAAFEQIGKFLEKTFNDAIEFISKKWGELKKYVLDTLTGWGTAVDNWFDKEFGIRPIAKILPYVREVRDAISEWSDKAEEFLFGKKGEPWFGKMKPGDLTPLQQMWKGITEDFEKWQKLLMGPEGLISLMGKFLAAMGDTALQKVQDAWDRLLSTMQSILQGFKDFFVDQIEKGRISERHTGKGSDVMISGVYGAVMDAEDGGPTAENKINTSSGHAQGYFQITTGTWRDFAPRAGVDLSVYPQALGTPPEIQARVASIIPLGRWETKERIRARYPWATDNMTLGEIAVRAGEPLLPTITPIPPRPETPPPPTYPHKAAPTLNPASRWGGRRGDPAAPVTAPTEAPLGPGALNDNNPLFNPSPMFPAHLAGGGASFDKGVSMTNDTDIHVYGSTDPVVTAHTIGEHQDRVASNMARLGKMLIA